LRGLSRERLIETALDTLARVLEADRSKIAATVAAVHYHDWLTDPYALGAYTYVPVNALDAVEALTRPVNDTLYFAGEAAEPSGNWGTVHGAMESGRRAARSIAGCRE
jgi:monoamine oxidase